MPLPSARTEHVDFRSPFAQQGPRQHATVSHDSKYPVVRKVTLQSPIVIPLPGLSVGEKKAVRHLRTNSQYAPR